MPGKLKNILLEYRRVIEAITGEHLQKIVLYGSSVRGAGNLMNGQLPVFMQLMLFWHWN